jgi:hypothetical protein
MLEYWERVHQAIGEVLKMKLVLGMAALALLSLGSFARADITMDTVAIGDAGNAADTRVMNTDGTTGYGSVGYSYNIGKYEVTFSQYVAFLNGVGETNVTKYGLYNNTYISNGGSGDTKYSVHSSLANHPVVSVSFMDTLRFANWMTNGQSNGDTESGSYTITDGGVDSGIFTIPDHAPGMTSKWFLSSEDEWYKAAYYMKGGGYSLYANGTDIAPIAGVDAHYNGDSAAYFDVGTCTMEQNGTYDMMGHAWEWNEGTPLNPPYPSRTLRGGQNSTSAAVIAATHRNYTYADRDSGHVGFRVSQTEAVPEPVSLLTFGIGAAGLAIRRRMRKSN